MNILSVITAGVLWGSMSIFVRSLDVYGIDSRQIMMCRSLISALILGIILLVKDRSLFRIKIKDCWMFLCTGIVSLSFFSVCYFSSILESGASVAVVLLYTSPVFVLILSAIFFNEKITRYKVMALILTAAGCIFVAGILGNSDVKVSVKGLLLGLGSGLGYGLYSIFGTVALKKYKPLTVTFYSFLAAAVFMMFISEPQKAASIVFAAGNGLKPAALFAGVSVFCTLLPFLLYTWGLSSLDAGKAAIFATVEPLAGTLIGILLWKEDAGFFKLAGIALIFVAILLCQKSTAKAFLKKHKFKSKLIVQEIIEDMSFAARYGSKNWGGQDMFRTWMVPPEKNPVNEKVIVIDAGGTNFRSCLITFDVEGTPTLSDFKKSTMPAIDREYSKKEFFEAIADRIDYLKDKADKIGFCFSYAMEITKDHDGIPNAFSKEVKAKEVLGEPVGKNLVEELYRRGWKKIEKITLLNDTVAALLAGVSGIESETQEKNKETYESYIGFILGTGMNGAFIDENNQLKDGRQIIVCESGKCKTIALSDFDKAVDSRTDIPGQYPLEKCCSGAYLGKTVTEILKTAAREKLFTKSTCISILSLSELSTPEVSACLDKEYGNEALGKICAVNSDAELVRELMEAAVDRVAKYAASILASCLIVCGKGKNPEKPVCIVCNGTTLYKTAMLKEKMEKYLYKYATKKQKIHFRTRCIENDIVVGTAVAGVI